MPKVIEMAIDRSNSLSVRSLSPGGWIALVTALLIAILVLWWEAPNAKENNAEFLPAFSQELSFETADATAVRGAQNSSAASAPLDEIKIRVRMVDEISRRSLEGLQLSLVPKEGVEELVGRSDEQGIAGVTRPEWPVPSQFLIRVPESLGGGEFRRSISVDPSKTSVIELPIYARLHVRILGERHSDSPSLQGVVMVVPFPDLPSAEALSDEQQRRVLAFSRISPEGYLKALRRMSLLLRDWREESPISSEADCVIDVCGDGPVAVSAIVSGTGTGVVATQLRRGETKELDLALVQDRKLRGYVSNLDRKGIGGVKVKIVEIAKVRKGEFIQRVEPPDTTRGELLGELLNGDLVSIREFFAITGEDGGYTATIGQGRLELTTSCFSDAWMPGYATRELPIESPSEVTMDMLVAQKSPKRMLARIGGEPARSLEIIFTEGPQRPRRMGFGMQYPAVVSDDSGYVDVSMLESRSTYDAVFHTSTKERIATEFECRNDGTIDFP